MRTLKQRDKYSCFACCACMITGETQEDFRKFVGHDGSEPDPNQQHPSKMRGFTDREVFKYLADRGYTLGNWPHWDTAVRFDVTPPPDHVIRTETQVRYPAVLTVESEVYPGFYHAVYWDGKCVRDPNPKRKARSPLTDYKIIEWSPVVVL